MNLENFRGFVCSLGKNIWSQNWWVTLKTFIWHPLHWCMMNLRCHIVPKRGQKGPKGPKLCSRLLDTLFVASEYCFQVKTSKRPNLKYRYKIWTINICKIWPPGGARPFVYFFVFAWLDPLVPWFDGFFLHGVHYLYKIHLFLK